MECNRDEALRAMHIAEQKLANMDVKGAKRLAMMAQKLLPELDGLSQLVAVIDIYLVSANKIKGETDWYGILGVDPVASDEVEIKQQYRRKAKFLHPDKNKSPGASGAFAMLSAAWNVLSDEDKRREYNRKLNIPAPNPPTKQTDGESFWTTCNSCMLNLEYLGHLLNKKLICPSCKKAFIATEMVAPETVIPPGAAQSWQSWQHGTGGAAGPRSSVPPQTAAGVEVNNSTARSDPGEVKPEKPRKKRRARNVEDPEKRALIRKARADVIRHLIALAPPGSRAPGTNNN